MDKASETVPGTYDLLPNYVISDNYICNKEWEKALDAFHEDTWHRRKNTIFGGLA